MSAKKKKKTAKRTKAKHPKKKHPKKVKHHRCESCGHKRHASGKCTHFEKGHFCSC